MSKPVIIITGANGFIGQHLVRYFAKADWAVKALVHHTPVEKIGSVTYHTYELGEKPDDSIFENTNYLVHAAYQHNSLYSSKNEPNINGLHTLVEASRQHNIKFVFISSFSAIPGAESNYGKIKSACEKRCDPEKDLIVKPGLVIGNGGLFGRMASTLQRSFFIPLIDGGSQPLQTIYIDDLCTIIRRGLEQNINGSFFVAEKKASSYKQFISAIVSKLGKKRAFIPVPMSLLLFMVRASAKLGIRLPISGENVLGLKYLTAFDTTNSEETFGIRFRTMEEAVALVFADNTASTNIDGID